jgi:hypothetical protein
MFPMNAKTGASLRIRSSEQSVEVPLSPAPVDTVGSGPVDVISKKGESAPVRLKKTRGRVSGEVVV